MSLWTKVRARWRTHDDNLLERELNRENAEPESSIQDAAHIPGAAGAPGSSALSPGPIDHGQGPPHES